MSTDVRTGLSARDADVRTPTIEPRDEQVASRRRPGRWRRLISLHWARVHWIFVTLLVLGVAFRVMTYFAYYPALIYTDSLNYLYNVDPLNPQYLDPIGYPLFILRPLLPLGGLRTVAAMQHVAGIGMAIAIYALARRLRAPHWLAALATAPILLDGYQLQIEENILSDVWLQVLIVAALWLLLGKGVPRVRRVALVGIVLALALMTRMVAITLVVPALLYVVLVGREWRTRAGRRRILARVGALCGCLFVVVAGYATYFHAKAGYWGINTASGNSIYGRTAVVADCSELSLDPTLAQLCPQEPPGQRFGPDYYAHLDADPNWPGYVPPGETKYSLDHQFAWKVIEQQPFAVARAVLVDFFKGFTWTKDMSPNDVPVSLWQFQGPYPVAVPPTQSVNDATAQVNAAAEQYGGVPISSNPVLTNILRDYQMNGGYTPGLALGICGLLGIGGALFGRGRAMRMSNFLIVMTALTLLGTAALFEFSWRYQLPGLVLLPLSGVLGGTALVERFRSRRDGRRRGLAPFPDPVDRDALLEFSQRYGVPSFAPVVVVIAAFNEENGIGGVLERLPDEVCGLGVDVVVVADGCSDGTVEVARGAGVCVVEVGVNRGQGAALRLGYGVARWGGARFVVTTDADGQYENGELGRLVGPLVAGEADFVTGSRRLGSAPGDDRVRWVGVRVFAWLASVLVGARVSDTSFGFRAMRVEVASGVRLRQPQYQASELLLGVFASGARVCEVPMTMRVRSAGKTKKGNNLVYGLSYARVMTWTWLREFVLLRLIGRRPEPWSPSMFPSAPEKDVDESISMSATTPASSQ